MRGQRTERLVRIAARFLASSSRQISLTDLAHDFNVSKTVISDDVEIINKAFLDEGLGMVAVDRGRTGGARFVPKIASSVKRECLGSLASLLSAPDRLLPGGLIYYSDVIFNPHYASMLGFILASEFSDLDVDVVMTTEVKGIPLGMFAAYALGVPLAVCRFRNRPSDGPAVGVHYPTSSGDVRTMYLGSRQLKRGEKVLVIDDFMRGGSTVAGMLLMTKEFGASVVGVGILIVAAEPHPKAIPDYRALLRLVRDDKGATRLIVPEWERTA